TKRGLVNRRVKNARPANSGASWPDCVPPVQRSAECGHGLSCSGQQSPADTVGGFFWCRFIWCSYQYVQRVPEDRKSTRLNSSHVKNSYAVFCLKKKTIK